MDAWPLPIFPALPKYRVNASRFESMWYDVNNFGRRRDRLYVRAVPRLSTASGPEPEGLTEQPLRPGAASWTPEGGTALLAYEEVRTSTNPRGTLLEFLQSAYEAGARTAGWDTEGFRTGAG